MAKMTTPPPRPPLGRPPGICICRPCATSVCAWLEMAQRSQSTYLGYLAEMLAAEVDDRAERRRQRRVHEARFPRIKRLSDFDLAAAPSVKRSHHLHAGLVGVTWRTAIRSSFSATAGTGKSHLLIGLGMAACEQGKAVRYVTCAALVNELAAAADERRLSRLVARYGRLDLLCLDELGYVQLDAKGAELLFQILTEREEKASIATASNLPFSEWGQVIGDPRLVAAIVDRLTFNAHIIETGTESFRLRSTTGQAGHGQEG